MGSVRNRKKVLTVLSFLCVALALTLLVYAFVPGQNARIDKGAFGRTPVKPVPNYVEGEVLAVFQRGVDSSLVRSIAGAYSMTVERTYPALAKVEGKEIALLRAEHKTTDQMIGELEKIGEVESVSPNYLRRIDQTVPNDTHFSDLWGLHNVGQTGGTVDIDIDAPEAWDSATGSSDVIVAVIDTGIDYNHPDLMGNLWNNPYEWMDGFDNDGNGYVDDIYGINGITGTGDPLDDHGHGTHCSGTIGAVGNNSLGVAGVNWDVSILSGKSFDAGGSGSDADAITCINYIVYEKTIMGQNIVAVNASWGGAGYNSAMVTAIDALGTADIVFCAAAGNDGTDNDASPHYPSSYTNSNIIAVTAVDHNGAQWYNYGATSVDIAAPGVEILSTIPGANSYTPAPGDIIYADMDTYPGSWTTGGTRDWQVTSTEDPFLVNPSFPVPSPPNFWADSPGVYYSNYDDCHVTWAGNINLSGYVGQDVAIGFHAAMYIEDYYDQCYLEFSDDGGSTWTPVFDWGNIGGGGYYWSPWAFLIPDSFKTTMFTFRFHLITDYSVTYEGFNFDNIGIGMAPFVYGYDSWGGTSMATPHVTGAVAFLASVFPSETAAERITRILNTAVPLGSLSGKCVTGGMLNLNDALWYNAAPDIKVRFASIYFADGCTRNLGTRTSSFIMGRNFTFWIENAGLLPMNLTGSPMVTISGPQAAHFYISQQPTSPVSGLDSTNFKLRTVRDSLPGFLPVGWTYPISITINIENDVPGMNPFDITLNFTLQKDS
jgi:subtilisin family serine protease